jgi:TatD DNase family protein
MLADSHCHLDRLDLTPYQNDFARMVSETAERGVDRMLCVSINLAKYSGMRHMIEPFPRITASVGVHPNEEVEREATVEELAKLADDAKVVAIGETGLDYYRSEGNLSWQQERFRRHIRAAKICGKPLIIHTRDAREDTLRILEEENAEVIGGVMHCFTEDWDTAQRAMDMGFYISFSGILTFKNAATIQEVARKMPEDRLLVETDSPYLAPIPFRGKPNYPAHVQHVARFLAELRGESFERIAEVTTRNFNLLFASAPA